jgi:hypothetical protein
VCYLVVEFRGEGRRGIGLRASVRSLEIAIAIDVDEGWAEDPVETRREIESRSTVVVG